MYTNLGIGLQHRVTTFFIILFYIQKGGRKNSKVAVKWFRKAANQGHAGAQNRLKKM